MNPKSYQRRDRSITHIRRSLAYYLNFYSLRKNIDLSKEVNPLSIPCSPIHEPNQRFDFKIRINSLNRRSTDSELSKSFKTRHLSSSHQNQINNEVIKAISRDLYKNDCHSISYCSSNNSIVNSNTNTRKYFNNCLEIRQMKINKGIEEKTSSELQSFIFKNKNSEEKPNLTEASKYEKNGKTEKVKSKKKLSEINSSIDKSDENLKFVIQLPRASIDSSISEGCPCPTAILNNEIQLDYTEYNLAQEKVETIESKYGQLNQIQESNKITENVQNNHNIIDDKKSSLLNETAEEVLRLDSNIPRPATAHVNFRNKLSKPKLKLVKNKTKKIIQPRPISSLTNSTHKNFHKKLEKNSDALKDGSVSSPSSGNLTQISLLKTDLKKVKRMPKDVPPKKIDLFDADTFSYNQDLKENVNSKIKSSVYDYPLKTSDLDELFEIDTKLDKKPESKTISIIDLSKKFEQISQHFSYKPSLRQRKLIEETNISKGDIDLSFLSKSDVNYFEPATNQQVYDKKSIASFNSFKYFI